MKTILVVDDEVIITKIIGNALKARYDVTTTNSGTQALEIMESTRLDLVIADMAMPDTDGIEILQYNRRRKDPIPIVIMSGNPIGRKFLHASSILGAVGTLDKPFTIEELFETVEKALE